MSRLLPLVRLGPDRIGDYAAFTDESSITGHRYMLVGGVSCRSHHAQHVHEHIMGLRAYSPYPTDSLQWKNYRPEKHDAYRRMIDFFVRENEAKRLDFTCLVVNTSQLKHATYNDGDGENFFQKMVYQIYKTNLLRKYEFPPVLRGFHGQRVSRYRLWEVQGIINRGAARDQWNAAYRPLRQFEYRDVAESGPHQLADTLLGAVSYYWNVGLQRGGHSRKRQLAEYVRSECCVSDLSKPTPITLPHFDIWHFRLR